MIAGINAGILMLDFCSTANLVLQDTIERLYAGNLYADIPRGVYLVRGENVLLLGEIVRFSSANFCGLSCVLPC